MNSEFHIILTLEEIRVISFYEFNSIYKTIGDVISEGKRRFEEAIGKEPKYFRLYLEWLYMEKDLKWNYRADITAPYKANYDVNLEQAGFWMSILADSDSLQNVKKNFQKLKITNDCLENARLCFAPYNDSHVSDFLVCHSSFKKILDIKLCKGKEFFCRIWQTN
tara:strand:+ start:455 stop:949 length:495 start_codon:yes stop_codon:yes gene_type:complete